MSGRESRAVARGAGLRVFLAFREQLRSDRSFLAWFVADDRQGNSDILVNTIACSVWEERRWWRLSIPPGSHSESIEFYHISEDANDLGHNEAPQTRYRWKCQSDYGSLAVERAKDFAGFH